MARMESLEEMKTPTKGQISAVMAALSCRRTADQRRGAPRKGEWCPCSAMTLKRAKARGRTREHKPSCAFYKA